MADMTPNVTFGSLFAGIGGIDLGLERAGMECKWQVEIDEYCRRVLAKHWPHVARYDDVRGVGAADLSPVDLITFGSPCQDLSVAGKRAGLDGERSGLFYEAIRIVGELKPAFAVFENVPGALSSNAGRDFAAVLGAFRELGARDIAWRVLDAQHFGVPQRRRRIFLVADFGGERAAEVLFESESVRRHPAQSRKAGSRLTTGTAGSAGARGTVGPLLGGHAGGHRVGADEAAGGQRVAHLFSTSGQSAWRSDQITLSASDDNGTNAVCVTGERMSALSREGGDASEDGTGRGTPIIPILEAGARQGSKNDLRDGTGIGEPGDPMFSLQASKQHGVAVLPEVLSQAENQRGELRTSETHPQLTTGGGKPGQGYPAIAFTERTRSEGRTFEWQEEQAYALTNPGSGGRTHSRSRSTGYGVRRLTPTECERLQGFPDDWTAFDADGKPISDSARYRMLGNAVCVNVVEWIMRRLVEVMR